MRTTNVYRFDRSHSHSIFRLRLMLFVPGFSSSPLPWLGSRRQDRLSLCFWRMLGLDLGFMVTKRHGTGKRLSFSPTVDPLVLASRQVECHL